VYKVSFTSYSLFLNLFNDSLSATELAYTNDQLAYYTGPTSIFNGIFETHLASYSSDLVNMNLA
jgi:hypothetical protein